MAKKKGGFDIVSFKSKSKVRRPGVHAKTKTSKLKSSRNYVKLYRGQGN